MAASITFTDSFGAATLTNGKPGPAGRFSNWVPFPDPVGDAVERDSDGATIMFQTRDDFGATFELRKIPVETASGVSMASIAARLRRHLLMGGQCSVTTGDSASHVYPTCGLKAGTKPELRMTDTRNIEYTLSLSLVNQAVSPVLMDCNYRGGT